MSYVWVRSAGLGAIVALLGCDGEADRSGGQSVCEEANAAVAACAEDGAAPDPLTSCGPEDEQAARKVLAQIEAAGCDAAPGKEDGFCDTGLWDPFGWCDEPLAPLGPEPQGKPTRYPIILAHGFNTSTTNFWAFNEVDSALKADGHVARLGSVPPFDTPMVRASFLAKQIDELLSETGAEKVNVVCFSMGGIDCRYLVSPNGLDYGDRVESVTMISSPNRGTAMADAGIKILLGDDDPQSEDDFDLIDEDDLVAAVDFVATLWGKTFSEVADDSHLVAALAAMSEKEMKVFNAEIGDHPRVAYYSWAGVSSLNGWDHPDSEAEPRACQTEHESLCDRRTPGGCTWRHEDTNDDMDVLLVGGAFFVSHAYEFIHSDDGGWFDLDKLLPNDGISTVESSKWGRFQGCIPADHLDQVGQVKDEGADEDTAFDHRRFYRNVAFDLADAGH